MRSLLFFLAFPFILLGLGPLVFLCFAWEFIKDYDGMVAATALDMQRSGIDPNTRLSIPPRIQKQLKEHR